MRNPIFKPGDIFLLNSNSTESKVVRFLMQSNTIWHWLIGKLYETIFRTTAPNWLIRYQKYYHGGIIYSETKTIEQNRIVEFKHINRFKGKDFVIIRKIKVSKEDQKKLLRLAKNDLGKGYDVLLILGKTLTYLTGIPLFTLLLNWPGKDLCITRIALWQYKTFQTLFGRLNYNFVQTDDIYYYAKSNPREYLVKEYKA